MSKINCSLSTDNFLGRSYLERLYFVRAQRIQANHGFVFDCAQRFDGMFNGFVVDVLRLGNGVGSQLNIATTIQKQINQI